MAETGEQTRPEASVEPFCLPKRQGRFIIAGRVMMYV